VLLLLLLLLLLWRWGLEVWGSMVRWLLRWVLVRDLASLLPLVR
jgi:hypothetical protein